ncbi:MAG: hypothetical protein Q9166_007710 [cf. Caloplaca sp. 2 TL-2023]
MPEQAVTTYSASKPIHCILPYPDDLINKAQDEPPKPSLIFTHGAGGTLASDAIANFSTGFALHQPILCFQGNMNLTSRIKMFSAVLGDQDCATTLGGRSMGARAAIMAATDETKHLMLVSYPLHTGKETRDQILLDIDTSMKVIFVNGDRDSMCDLSRLEEVRKKMRYRTWRIVVEGADHGMDVKPKKATKTVGMKVGEVIAEWIEENSDSQREGWISYSKDGEAKWTGWKTSDHNPESQALPRPKTSATQESSSKASRPPPDGNEPKGKKRRLTHSGQINKSAGEGVHTRTRSAKRTKQDFS